MTQHGWAVVCYCVGLVAELVGGYVVITAASGVRAVKDKRSLTDNEDGTFTVSTDQVDALIRAQALPIWAMVSLAVGIVMGFVGNLLSL